MRLKSQLWIQAYIRTCANENCPAMVVRHGDNDAGAPFIKINHLDGTASLYGPAPAGFTEVANDQRFVALMTAPETTEAEVDDYIQQQYAFDPDL